VKHQRQKAGNARHLLRRQVRAFAVVPAPRGCAAHRSLKRQGAVAVHLVIGADAVRSLIELGWLGTSDGTTILVELLRQTIGLRGWSDRSRGRMFHLHESGGIGRRFESATLKIL
jgi:hypothetical protein